MQAGPRRRAPAGQPRGAARLGLRRRLRRRDVADAAAGRAGRLRRRHGRDAGRCGELCERRSTPSGSTTATTSCTDERFVRPAEVDLLVADPSKARERLGWKPTVRFRQLVRDDGRGGPRAARRHDGDATRALVTARTRVRRAVGDAARCVDRGWCRHRRTVWVTRRAGGPHDAGPPRGGALARQLDVTRRRSTSAPSLDACSARRDPAPRRGQSRAGRDARIRARPTRSTSSARCDCSPRSRGCGAAVRSIPSVLVIGSGGAVRPPRAERDAARRRRPSSDRYTSTRPRRPRRRSRRSQAHRSEGVRVIVHAQLQPLRARASPTASSFPRSCRARSRCAPRADAMHDREQRRRSATSSTCPTSSTRTWRLLERGAPGEVYNVVQRRGRERAARSPSRCLQRVGVDCRDFDRSGAVPARRRSGARSAVAPSCGARPGWTPRHTLDDIIDDLIHAATR